MHSFQTVGCSCRPHCLIVKTNFIVYCIWWWFCRFEKLCLRCSAVWSAERFYSVVLILTLHGTTRNTASHVTLLEVGCVKMSFVYCPFPTDVIHTVGPVARGHVGPTETNDLTSCYQNSLRLMKEHGLSTVVSTVRHRSHTHLRRIFFFLCSVQLERKKLYASVFLFDSE